MASPERRRPWYLLLALIGALVFGALGGSEGYDRVVIYRGEGTDPSAVVQGITDDADRSALSTQIERWYAALDAARDRSWPLGVATALVGFAVLVFAFRAMAGRGGARPVLVQLVTVQAGLGIASFWLLREVNAAEKDVLAAKIVADVHGQVPERARADDMARVKVRFVRALPPVVLVLRTHGSALIVFALTRPRTREFFEAASDAAVEQ
jgi:hypothetical protein